MGSVLSTAAAYAGEDLVRFLPFIAILFLICWIFLNYFFGGCGPFFRQLIDELRGLLGLPPLPPANNTQGQAPLLGGGETPSFFGHAQQQQRGTFGGAGQHGYDGRWGYVTQPRNFAPPIQQALVRALSDQNTRQQGAVPAEFMCPITQDVMRDPVLAADGHTYEYEAVQRWIGSHMNSPVTNARLANVNLVQNNTLRGMIVTAGEQALAAQQQEVREPGWTEA